MDLGTVTTYRSASTRADLRLAPGERLLGGGTWLFSEPQPGTTGLVDLTSLGWPPFERLPDGTLRIAATCTVAQVVAVPWPTMGPTMEPTVEPAVESEVESEVGGAPGAGAGAGGVGALARTAADALLMSFKIQGSATLGGNLCLALPAGAMLAFTAALAGEVVVWTPDGGERREPVTDFVTGAGTTTLAPGEVVRAVDLPASSLRCRTAGRRMALTPRGRTSVLVLGRADEHGATLTITAATTRPVVVGVPAADSATRTRALEAGLARVDCWYDDAHGAADWRAAVAGLLAAEVLEELTR